MANSPAARPKRKSTKQNYDEDLDSSYSEDQPLSPRMLDIWYRKPIKCGDTELHCSLLRHHAISSPTSALRALMSNSSLQETTLLRPSSHVITHQQGIMQNYVAFDKQSKGKGRNLDSDWLING